MSWFIVGMVTTSSNETTARRLCHARAVVSPYPSFAAPSNKKAEPCLPDAASRRLLESASHEISISSDAGAPGQAPPAPRTRSPQGRLALGRPLLVFDELSSLLLIDRDSSQFAVTLGSDLAQPSDDTAGARRD
jgi:hypothetical protein